LIEKMVSNQGWSDEWLQPHKRGMHSLKEADMLAAKMDLCWQSLTQIFYPPKYIKMTTNKIYLSKIGLLSNKFHEFWCSNLSCRIFNFSPRKTFSNEYLEGIIVKNSSKQSRRIFYSYILEHKWEDME
jgi:hypothetical protein